MPLPLFQVGAFTDRPFAGNPAAVCLCFDAVPEEAQFQQIAAEMNLSETAFVLNRPGSGFDLYWFTPTQEVDLCGHATLAAAHVLWDEGHVSPDAEISFHTRSGQLTVRWQEGGWIEMDFPAEPVEACKAPDALTGALEAEPAFVGQNRLDVLVLLESEAAVRNLSLDLRLLEDVEARGVIVTAEADDPEAGPFDFVSRYFAPAYGIPEDPVTGSAHCALAPFWAERLGQQRLTGRQVSARGGTVRVEAQGERDGAPSSPHHGHSVLLSGRAVTVLRGMLEL